MTFKARFKVSQLAAALFLIGSAGALTACQALQAVVPPAPKTPAQAIYEVKSGLIVAEDAAVTFDQQVCPVAASCTDSRVTTVNNAVIAADKAISVAEAAVTASNTDATALQQAVTAAQNALTALQGILTQYGVKLTTTTTNGSS